MRLTTSCNRLLPDASRSLDFLLGRLQFGIDNWGSVDDTSVEHFVRKSKTVVTG